MSITENRYAIIIDKESFNSLLKQEAVTKHVGELEKKPLAAIEERYEEIEKIKNLKIVSKFSLKDQQKLESIKQAVDKNREDKKELPPTHQHKNERGGRT